MSSMEVDATWKYRATEFFQVLALCCGKSIKTDCGFSISERITSYLTFYFLGAFRLWQKVFTKSFNFGSVLALKCQNSYEIAHLMFIATHMCRRLGYRPSSLSLFGELYFPRSAPQENPNGQHKEYWDSNWYAYCRDVQRWKFTRIIWKLGRLLFPFSQGRLYGCTVKVLTYDNLVFLTP